jgi:hypothetical protein
MGGMVGRVEMERDSTAPEPSGLQNSTSLVLGEIGAATWCFECEMSQKEGNEEQVGSMTSPRHKGETRAFPRLLALPTWRRTPATYAEKVPTRHGPAAVGVNSRSRIGYPNSPALVCHDSLAWKVRESDPVSDED